MLDTTLELEGLLMLKLHRGENVPEETDALIAEKLASLSSLSEADDIAASVQLEETEDAEPQANADEKDNAEVFDNPQPSGLHEKPDVSDKPEVSEVISHTPAPQPSQLSINDVTKAFTLNDKFRFRRELFRNSDTELAETLDVLQAMDSIEEAEDYLYNDLAWDQENPDVQDFIALITPCYSRS